MIFPKKRMNGIFVHVLEYRPTLDKMQSYPSFSYCRHGIVYQKLWLSDWVVDCIHIDYIFRPSATGTMPLITQILRTAKIACNFVNN